MECNKDEALRAKEIAVRKFTEKDFNGAKKFASKAKSLFPDLEGISQFLMILDVHISAENKIGGETNWYSILGASPVDSEDTIKKQYRKLALNLHPDKNKAPGADAAFQFVLDAYGVLSDKVKKPAFDQKFKYRPQQVRVVPTQVRVPTVPPKSSNCQPKFPVKAKMSAQLPKKANLNQKVDSNNGRPLDRPVKTSLSAYPPSENGHHKSAGSAVPCEKTQGSSSQMGSIPMVASTRERNSFWTSCTTCKMQYEYLREFLNKTLLCPHCQKAFKAVETPPPSNLSPAPKWQQPQQQHQKPQLSARTHSQRGNHSINDYFNAAQGLGSCSSAFAQGTGIGRMGNDQVKRGNDDIPEGGGSLKRKMVQDEKLSWSSFSNAANPFGTVNREMNGGIPSTYFASSGYRPSVNGELSQVETRTMLFRKAAAEVGKMLSGWKLEIVAKAAAKENRKVQERERQRRRLDKSFDDLNFDEPTESPTNNFPLDGSAPVTQEVPAQIVSMDVPDSDFHDFDSDRTEHCFQDNDIWAAYDTDDGMPRFYALVHEVISSNPFKMRISWLNSKSNSEFGPVKWVSYGFTKTCGEFRIGKHEMNGSLNSFSHKVVWDKGPRGVIQIYPRKGDVWALFKNWSPSWDDETPDEVRHVYEMVEVVEEYTEDRGVTVSPLMKAPDFRTVFHRQLDTRNLKRIPKEEMFRFSHQVPSHFLTADQVPGAPDSCIELDPAATPTELL